MRNEIKYESTTSVYATDGLYCTASKVVVVRFFLLALTTAGDVLGAIIVKIFIDDYLAQMTFPLRAMIGLATAYIMIHIGKVFLSYFQLLKFQEIALKIIQQLRIDVFAKVQSLGMRYFDRTPAGSIVSRVTNDTEAIKEMFVEVLVTFIQSAFS